MLLLDSGLELKILEGKDPDSKLQIHKTIDLSKKFDDERSF